MNRCGSVLYDALSREYGVHVDLIALAKLYSKPIVLLTDVPSFIRYIYTHFVSATPDDDLLLDEAPLRRYEFAEFSKLRAIVMLFIAALRQNNLELEFVDGSSSVSDTATDVYKAVEHSTTCYRRISRLETELNSRQIIAVCRCFGVCSQGIPLAPLTVSQVYSAIEAAGCRLWITPDQIEVWMYEIMVARCERHPRHPTGRSVFRSLPRIFALLSDNIELCLIGGSCRVIPMSMFDESSRLSWLLRVVISGSPEFVITTSMAFPRDRLNQLPALDAYVFGPEQLASMAEMPVTQLYEAVIFLGNQFTSPFYDRHPNLFGTLPRPYSLADLKQASEAFFQSISVQQVEKVPIIEAALAVVPELFQAIQFSRILYGIHSHIQAHQLLEDSVYNNYQQWRLGRNIITRLLPWPPKFGIRDLLTDWRASSEEDQLKTIVTLLSHVRCLPMWLQRACVKRIYYRTPHLEYITSITLGIEDVFVELRKWCYGIVCDPDTIVVEYGRSQSGFDAQVSVFPYALLPHLTLIAVIGPTTGPWTQENGMAATREFIYLVISSFDKSEIDRRQNASLLELYLLLLDALRYPTITESLRSNCFLRHEIESLVVSMIATASRCRHWTDTRLAEFNRAKDEIHDLYSYLRDTGVDLPSEDPFNLCHDVSRQHCKYINRIGLHGLIPGFRATVVYGWFQMIWEYLMDIHIVYAFSTVGEVAKQARPSPSLLFNGDIFRWFYAVGALEWAEGGSDNRRNVPGGSDGLPTSVHSTVRRQSKCVRLMRTALLKSPTAKRLLPWIV